MKIWVDANPEKICVVTQEGVMLKDTKGTNNENEYKAVLFAVTYLTYKTLPLQCLTEEHVIYSDSQLVVNQLNCKYNINEDRLRRLAEEIWYLIEYFSLKVRFEWIPREENKAGKVLGD